jgi:hypothetical protein
MSGYRFGPAKIVVSSAHEIAPQAVEELAQLIEQNKLTLRPINSPKRNT